MAIGELRGVVHGRTIELEQESGLPEGQQVEVSLRPVAVRGEGLKRAFGAWADDAEELDRFMEEIRLSRKHDRPGPSE